MSYNTKNYTEQNGEKTVIGGTLEFTDEAKVVNFPKDAVPQMEFQADSSATTVSALKDDLNALLSKLKATGLMAAEAPKEPETEEEAEDEPSSADQT